VRTNLASAYENQVKQRTIQQHISTVGIGVHTADKVQLTFRPAPIDTGIVFVRTDIDGLPTISPTPTMFRTPPCPLA
jgi:UDP-3-O-acyl-N-acetylglucosamine deacetylase